MNAQIEMTPHAARRELANVLRMLAVDAVEAAKSGHPGSADGHGRDIGGVVAPIPET